MTLAVSILALAATVIAAVAALGSWRASSVLARIERDRRHSELTPQFEASGRISPGASMAQLWVALIGPPALDRLDEIVVAVQNDTRREAPTHQMATGPTREQIEAQVWGPWRFTPGVDGADANGRAVAPFALRLGEGRPFQLEPNPPPPWSGPDSDSWWRAQYADSPIRLEFRCRRGPDERWVVPCRLDQPTYRGPLGSA